MIKRGILGVSTIVVAIFLLSYPAFRGPRVNNYASARQLPSLAFAAASAPAMNATPASISGGGSEAPGKPRTDAAGSESNGHAAAPLCTGIPITEVPKNVTGEFSQVAAGVTITQVTNDSGHNWNSHSDLPAFSSLTNALVFNHGNNPAQVAVADLDGTHAQVISGSHQATAIRVSSDGKFAFYQGQNPNQGADIYAVPLSQPGNCKEIRLSQLNMRFVPPVGALIITTSSVDPTSGKNEILFSEGNILHRVLDDGTVLPDLTLGDPENGNAFHRIGRNPNFPDVLWYKRDRPAPDPGGVAEPEIWVVNLKSPGKVYNLMANTPVDHPAWSPDGTRLGFITNRGKWHVADVLKPDGSFSLNSEGNFKITEVGPSYASGLSVNFCTYAPDGSVFVCSQRNNAIYLMSLDGTKSKLLVNPESSPTGAVYNAIPKPRFLDMEHIVFSSDRTGLAQVYVISGFTTTFP